MPDNELHLLLECTVCRVEHQGVVGLAEWGEGALSILPVSLFDLLQHLVEGSLYALLVQVAQAASCPHGGISHHEDFEVGVRKDDGPDVAPV
jgi:hypothetical protein